jgi:hypothetical protein
VLVQAAPQNEAPATLARMTYDAPCPANGVAIGVLAHE